jgi:hypothetical protein
MNVNPSFECHATLGTPGTLGTLGTPGTQFMAHRTVTFTGVNCRLIAVPSGVLATPLT